MSFLGVVVLMGDVGGGGEIVSGVPLSPFFGAVWVDGEFGGGAGGGGVGVCGDGDGVPGVGGRGESAFLTCCGCAEVLGSGMGAEGMCSGCGYGKPLP